MKKLIFVLIVVFFGVSVVHAQEPTATDVIDSFSTWLGLFLASLPGLLTNLLMDEIVKIPGLTNKPEEQQAIRDSFVKILTVVISLGLGYATAFVANRVDLVNGTGFWVTILASLPASQVWYETRKTIKSVAVKNHRLQS